MIGYVMAGDAALLARLEALPPAIIAALRARLAALAERLRAKVADEKLAGLVLKERSGALRRSIATAIDIGPGEVTVRLFAGGDLKYAAIQEFGGYIPPHEIRPSKAAALAFLMDGKQVFARRVRFPGATLPERSYLRATLDELGDEIAEGIRDAVAGAIDEARP